MDLKNKVAIVTGAGQWIGRAIALRLARDGADIVVDDIIIERANKVVNEIEELGQKGLSINADVTQSREVDKMVEDTLKKFGKIDILVNNVGGPTPSFFAESSEEVWDAVLARNLKGVRNCCRAVIGYMIERNCGRIINISSVAGITGAAHAVDYSAAKGGIIALTMALAKEVATYGIRINCVSPGPIGAADSPPDQIEAYIRSSGIGREGKPEEIAAVVAFLASDESDYITGQNYPVCGLSNLGIHGVLKI